MKTKKFPDQPFDPVPTNSFSHFLAHRKTEAPGVFVFRTFQNDKDEIRRKITTAPIITFEKVGPFRYAKFSGKSYAANRFLPFALLRRRMARPLLVLERTRKPQVLCLLVLLG